MRNIFKAALVPVLAVLAFGCSSSTGLQTSEPDDLYYSSADRTMRREMNAPASGSSASADNSVYEESEAGNPEYYDPGTNRTSVTNNYYYDDDRRYVSRGRRSYMYYNDPFYSPFGYSAAYCYGIYDPFCFPGYYPYSGITVSIGYGWGNPYGYGWGGYRPYGAYGYGYRPYDMYGYYGGGYGGYYQGFYDGYHAGNGYGYGYNRQRTQYGPRGDRSFVPATSTATGGRGAAPGRSGSGTNVPDRTGNDPGRVGRTEGVAPANGRPARVTSSQPGNVSPGRVAPASEVGRPDVQPGRSEGISRPSRNTETVRPENYQFQTTEQPSLQPDRPAKGRGGLIPNRPQVQPQQQDQSERINQQAVPAQPQRPVRESMSRPAQRETRTAPSNYDRPSYQDNSPSRGSMGGGGSAPARSGGRPRN